MRWKSGQYLKELAHSVLRRLLQRVESEVVEAKPAVKVGGDFPHETIEGSLADQEVRRPLVLSDLTQRDRADAEPVRPSEWGARRGVACDRNARNRDPVMAASGMSCSLLRPAAASASARCNQRALAAVGAHLAMFLGFGVAAALLCTLSLLL